MSPQSSPSRDEQFLYDHWLPLVTVELPEALVNQFRGLFVEGFDGADPAICQTLRRIVRTPSIDDRFKYILNRSSHILINHWRMEPYHHPFVHQLVGVLGESPRSPARTESTQRLRTLVRRFLETDEYQALQRYVRCVVPLCDADDPDSPLETSIHRYPYLYDHVLLTDTSDEEQQQTVRVRRQEAERKLEVDLSQYVVYRKLRQQREDLGLEGPQTAPADPRGHRAGQNPTLLSDRALDSALEHFGNQFHGGRSYRSLSNQFRDYVQETRNYRSFKAEFHSYLTSGCPSRYVSDRLNTFLRDLYPESDGVPLTRNLVLRTCQKLLNFLVVESPFNFDPSQFTKLLNSLGHQLTIGLILRIALFCQQIKPWVERQFSILFKHYEAMPRQEVSWLVEALENLNIALLVNFGSRLGHQWRLS